MIDLITQTEYSQPMVKGKHYKSVIPDKVLEPDEFQWNSEDWEELVMQLRTLDKCEICLAVIREKYEQTNSS